MNLFSDCCIFCLADHTSVFCFSLIDLRILTLVDKGTMHFDAYFCFFFSLILRILLFVFHAEVSNLSEVMLRNDDAGYHCRYSALIMTNGIRTVRLGVDIFRQKNS